MSKIIWENDGVKFELTGTKESIAAALEAISFFDGNKKVTVDYSEIRSQGSPLSSKIRKK